MASARRKGVAKVDIYQDPEESIEESELARTLQNYNNALQPAKNDVMNTDIVLGPPTAQVSTSPTKRLSPQSSPQLDVDQSILDSIIFPPPEGFFPTDSPVKKTNYAPYFAPIAQKPQKGLFTTFSSSGPRQKENQRLSISSIPTFNASDPLYSKMPNFGKRPAADGPYMERPVKRAKIQEEFVGPLPAPEDMPPVPDEEGKPNFSYAQLIGMAILRAPERKMTLSQIYKWISDTFSFYRNGQAGAGWQNSIRHNLSLNKAFVKKERPKEDPGKGNYWAIQDGLEAQFFKDRSFRRPTTADQPYFEPPQSDTCPLPAAPLPQITSAPATSAHADSSTFPNESVSSDATLPMSDQLNDQSQSHDTVAPAPRVPSPAPALMSSPPLDLNSSPPIPRHPQRNESPACVQHSSLTPSGGQKKRLDGFKDSGFYSSVESSVPRGQAAPILTSEADHRGSVLKRGRAEEEIARMRGSSFDPSPTKIRQVFKKPRLDPNLNSSSPLRGSSIGFPPLTPGLKLRPSTKAPPTVSPGTHLRRHRENIRNLVGTPVPRESLSAEDIRFTPSFIFADSNAVSPQFSPVRSMVKASPLKNYVPVIDNEIIKLTPPNENQDFSLATLLDDESDENADPNSLEHFFASGSPIAKKTQRSNLHRAVTSTSALQDITNTRQNARLGSPIRLSPPRKTKARGSSPAKKMEQPKNDVFLGAAGSSDEDGRKAALDLTKGFHTIGTSSGKENKPLGGSMATDKMASKSKTNRRPLGKSSTNLI